MTADAGAAAAGISVSHVRRAFGSVLAVDDMSLEARPGEITALIGPNGSGKTTLMLMLASLLVPDHGAIRVAGHDPVTQPREVRARLGWMPDSFGTWDALKVREVLQIMASAYGITGAPAQQRIASLLQLVHLDDLAERPARVLSRVRSSAWDWPGPWSTTPASSSSTSRRTGSTRAAGSSCATSSASSPRRAARSS